MESYVSRCCDGNVRKQNKNTFIGENSTHDEVRQKLAIDQCAELPRTGLFDLRLENQPRAFAADALHPALSEVGRLCHQRLGRPDGAVVMAFGALNAGQSIALDGGQ